MNLGRLDKLGGTVTVFGASPGGEGILALRSRRAVIDALYRLMERDDYQALTITQICQEAGIARQTFYHHFPGKQEVLEHDLQTAFLMYTQKHPDSGRGEENLRQLFADFPISREKLLLLRKQGLFHMLSQGMIDFLPYSFTKYQYEHFLGRPEYDHYKERFIVSTLVTVLSCWVDNGFSEKQEELTEITAQMLGRC